MSDPLSDITRLFKEIKAPLFDRITVRDMRVLHDVPRGTVGDSIRRLYEPRLYGIPVVIDERVETGVIELRLGDKLYKRVYLAELRA